MSPMPKGEGSEVRWERMPLDLFFKVVMGVNAQLRKKHGKIRCYLEYGFIGAII